VIPTRPAVSRNATPNTRPAQSSNIPQNGRPDHYPNVDPAKPVKKKRSLLKAVLITLLVIVVLAASSFIAFGFYVDSLDTIFPNVWADGINVSGLTLNEAIEHLIYAGYENNADGISVTVSFPDNASFTVTGDEVGLSFNAAEAAAAAFAFGRGDTFFRNEMQYIRSLLERTDLKDLSTPTYDDTIVRVLAAEFANNFNNTLFDGNLTPGEDYITVTRGSGLHPALEDEVIELAISTLLQAISEHNDLTVHYIPTENADDSVESQIYELQLLFDSIHLDPVSAYWDVETLSATESSYGRTFDLDRAIENLRRATDGQTILIEFEELAPELTQEYVESLIFAHTLASSTTRELSGNSNRLRNIQVAADKINGTVLNPGDVFSFNGVVGRRTTDAGFRAANTIVGGVFEPGIGGGICQVSSTIHDAVLHTDLEVVERHPHGLKIGYMPVGDEGTVIFREGFNVTEADEKAVAGRRFANDAMVNWGTNDYKFRNNTDFPLRIDATVDGRNLTVKLIGTKLDDTYIVIETVVLDSFASGTVEILTETLPEGTRQVREGASGQRGYRAETFKLHFSADGELLSRTSLGRNRYSAQSRMILIGTAVYEPPPEAPPAPPPEVPPEAPPETPPETPVETPP